jgi:hypothetical protein
MILDPVFGHDLDLRQCREIAIVDAWVHANGCPGWTDEGSRWWGLERDVRSCSWVCGARYLGCELQITEEAIVSIRPGELEAVLHSIGLVRTRIPLVDYRRDAELRFPPIHRNARCTLIDLEAAHGALRVEPAFLRDSRRTLPEAEELQRWIPNGPEERPRAEALAPRSSSLPLYRPR